MKSVRKAIQCLMTNSTISASEPDYICPHCDQVIPKLQVEIMGMTRLVQPKCKCETDKFLQGIRAAYEYDIKKRIEEKFSICNLGERFAECRFDTFQWRPGTEKALKNALSFVDQFEGMDSDGLLIWGDAGNGKSHLAAAIAHEIKSKGKTVVFQTVPELLERIRNTFNNKEKETEREIMEALLQCDLLILDDIGSEKVSEWVLDVIFRIVDGRYRQKRAIVYTTNHKPSELKNWLDPKGRIYDRMVETSVLIENKGTSYRREVARRRMGQLQGDQP